MGQGRSDITYAQSIDGQELKLFTESGLSRSSDVESDFWLSNTNNSIMWRNRM